MGSVKLCLDSVLEHGGYNKIIIIDDCSETVTHDMLTSYCITEKGRNVQLIRNAKNIGYTKSANLGLHESDAEYKILLNSDAVVTSNWIDSLKRCFDTYPRTGIVGPLSNNGGWQSIDISETGLINSKLKDIPPIYPKVNFVNGFCYMINNKVINEIGYLDELSFPIGYGEEDDFSIRANDKGYELRIADNTFIYHEKSMSFEKSKIQKLKANGYKMLCKKHGKTRINQLLYEMNTHRELRLIKKKIYAINK